MVATLRSLGRRWHEVLDRDAEGAALPFVEAAIDALIVAARVVQADVGRFGTRPASTASGIAEAANTIAATLEGAHRPFEREGVHEAAVAAAHAGTHHLRQADKVVSTQ